VMGIGAMSWLAGNLAWWSGRQVYEVYPLWGGFLLLTIAGERLELSRVLKPARSAQRWFVLACLVYLIGVAASLVARGAGIRLSGLGMAALAIWLLWNDLARRTLRSLRSHGVTRYMAISIQGGYVWLLVSGLLALRFGGVAGGVAYDAVVHSFFLGFVLAMIFGHAPLILPAMIGGGVIYSSRFHLHLALLHLSMALRLGADPLGWPVGRQWGGMLNGLAVLAFMISTLLQAAARLRTPVVNRPAGAPPPP
jgi:hypothetical protein